MIFERISAFCISVPLCERPWHWDVIGDEASNIPASELIQLRNVEKVCSKEKFARKLLISFKYCFFQISRLVSLDGERSLSLILWDFSKKMSTLLGVAMLLYD